MKYSTASYKQALIDIHPGKFECMGEYCGGSNKILHKCLICGTIAQVQPRLALMGRGCMHCRNLKLRWTEDRFIQEMQAKSSSYQCLDSYQGIIATLRFKHVACGFIVHTTPERMLARPPKCRNCERAPPIPKTTWCKTTQTQWGVFPSAFEAECADIVFGLFETSDIHRNKPYCGTDARSCDFYITSMDLWIEVSLIQKQWYLDRINRKRQLVQNFIFATTVVDLVQQIQDHIYRKPT